MHTYVHTYIHTYIHTKRGRQTDRQAGRQTAAIHTYIHRYIVTYMHTYIHTYIHAYFHFRTYIQMYIHAHTCISTDTHNPIHPSVRACVRECMHACMHACMQSGLTCTACITRKTCMAVISCRIISYRTIMFTSPPKDVSPRLRNKSPDPASEPLTSTSLKSFSVPLSFHLYEQDSGYIFFRCGRLDSANTAGDSNYVLGIGFCNYAGDSKYEVDIMTLSRCVST